MKIDIQIRGDIDKYDVSTLKDYILEFCKNNRVNAYIFTLDEEYN